MPERLRAAVAPAFLFACLLLGGSAQGIWGNMLLQLGGLALLGWAAAHSSDERLPAFATQILLIAIAALAVIALQAVLIPWALWSQLGPRHSLASAYELLGLGTHAQPLSLAPYLGFDTLVRVIPALGLFCAIVRLKAYRPDWLVLSIFAATMAGILLGLLQVAATSRFSRWYLYPETNFGSAVGFFANTNHMATLLVVNLPFLAAFAARRGEMDSQRRSAGVALVAGAGLVVLVGIALNGSLAGYGLAVPVLAASALIVFRAGGRLRLWAFAAIALMFLACVAAIETRPVGAQLFGQEASTSVESRQDIFATTSQAVRDFLPFGSGLGTFRSVYHLYEEPTRVSPTYVIHAHNDYLELALELGLPGIILIILFLLCWSRAVWRVWKTGGDRPLARAAAIGSAAILVHSLVDFPLRTGAISALFATCLALIAMPRSAMPKDAGELRETRHVVFR
ncbi:MAG: O-antigen ligase family protein [Bacillota bacterium]